MTEMSCGPRLQRAFSSGRTLPRLRRLAYTYRMRPSWPSSSSCFTARTPGWYSSRCPTMRMRPAAWAAEQSSSASAARKRHRLLDERVLAGLQHAHAQRIVAGHRRGQHDGVQRRVGQQGVEVVGDGGAGELGARPRQDLLVQVAAVRELHARQAVEVAGEVGAPVAEAHHADADLVRHLVHHPCRGPPATQPERAAHSSQSFHTVPLAGMPAVALRRSTTSGACITTSR